MQLPFSREEFLDVFGRYNSSVLPVAIAMWVASLLALLLLFSPKRASWQFINIVLAMQWVWSAAGYHVAFFTRINPAAWGFAVLFLAQAVLVLWLGVIHERMRFWADKSARNIFGYGLIVYAMVYPAIGLVPGDYFPKVATFGIPCPTAVLTAGFMLETIGPAPRLALLVPILWAFIGGSAAVLLGMRADWFLSVAGIALLIEFAGTRDKAVREKI